LVGLGTIISVKALNEKKGIRVLPEGVCLRSNKKIILWLGYLYGYIKNFNFKIFVLFVKKTLRFFEKLILKFVQKVFEKIEEKDARIIKFVKGEKILNRNGEASKFLQDVTEHKKSLKQDINENLPG